MKIYFRIFSFPLTLFVSSADVSSLSIAYVGYTLALKSAGSTFEPP